MNKSCEQAANTYHNETEFINLILLWNTVPTIGICTYALNCFPSSANRQKALFKMNRNRALPHYITQLRQKKRVFQFPCLSTSTMWTATVALAKFPFPVHYGSQLQTPLHETKHRQWEQKQLNGKASVTVHSEELKNSHLSTAKVNQREGAMLPPFQILRN